MDSAVDDGEVKGFRRAVIQSREKVRLKLLIRALELYPDQAWRPVRSLRQRDKLSSAWTLCLPRPETTMAPAEFAEAMASFLCLPSLVCVGRVGELLSGRKRVGVYGDKVASATLPGGGHKTRHDEMKWAGLDVRCEV